MIIRFLYFDEVVKPWDEATRKKRKLYQLFVLRHNQHILNYERPSNKADFHPTSYIFYRHYGRTLI